MGRVGAGGGGVIINDSIKLRASSCCQGKVAGSRRQLVTCIYHIQRGVHQLANLILAAPTNQRINNHLLGGEL